MAGHWPGKLETVSSWCPQSGHSLVSHFLVLKRCWLINVKATVTCNKLDCCSVVLSVVDESDVEVLDLLC